MGILKGRSEEYVINTIKDLDINVQLVKSAEYGLYNYAVELLKKGADIHYENNWAFITASKKGQYNIVKLFLEHITKLHWIAIQLSILGSISEGYLNVAMLLIEKLYEKEIIDENDYKHYNNILNKTKRFNQDIII